MTTLVALSDGPVICLYAIAIYTGELTLLPDPYSPSYKPQVYVARLVDTVARSPSGSTQECQYFLIDQLLSNTRAQDVRISHREDPTYLSACLLACNAQVSPLPSLSYVTR